MRIISNITRAAIGLALLLSPIAPSSAQSVCANTAATSGVVCPAAPRQPSADTGDVRGVVAISVGGQIMTIENASLILSGRQVYVIHTDSDGSFDIPSVEPGTYHVVATVASGVVLQRGDGTSFLAYFQPAITDINVLTLTRSDIEALLPEISSTDVSVDEYGRIHAVTPETVVAAAMPIMVVRTCDRVIGPPLGFFEGSIGASNGARTSGAKISLVGPARYTTKTDANGAFAIAGIVPGEYQMTIARHGFDTALSAVVIASEYNACNDEGDQL